MLKINATFKRLVKYKLLAALILGASSALADYPQVTVKNYSPHQVEVLVDYPSIFCSNDTLVIPAGSLKKGHEDRIDPGTKTASGTRGVCLVSSITVTKQWGGHEEIQKYDPEVDTSYSQFSIYPSGKGFKILSSAEIKYEKQTTHETPGFVVHNKTQVPLTISLDEIGCLYYENSVMPNTSFDRNTGAVYFTITARIAQKDNKLTNWQCAVPVLEDVGVAALALAFGGATAAWNGVKMDGAKIMATIGLSTVSAIGKAVMASTYANYKGAYAGAPWPFRSKCKPEYEVTGGPDLKGVHKAKSAEEAAKKMEGSPKLEIKRIPSKC